MARKILIIEDEENLAELYQLKFEQEGFIVFTSENGREGIEIAKQEQPDLILLDILLPNMNGYQVIDELKKDERTKDISVFFLSNLVQNGEVRKGIEAGAKEYLIKSSMTPSQLVERVKKFFSLQDSASKEAPDRPPPAKNVPLKKAAQSGGYRVLLIEDNDALIEMYLQQFFREGMSVEVAKNGAWGIKLAKQNKFDIIIIDMVMPALDGHNTVKDLRKNSLTMDTPIIILSNSAQDGDITKAKQAGASAYLLKSSVTPVQITKEIFKLLNSQTNDNRQ